MERRIGGRRERERGERGIARRYRADRGAIDPIICGSEETILWFVFEFCVFI